MFSSKLVGIPNQVCNSSSQPTVSIVIGCGATPAKTLFRLRLQKSISGVVPQPLVRVGAMVSTFQYISKGRGHAQKSRTKYFNYLKTDAFLFFFFVFLIFGLKA